ncbi:MAG: hydrogenase maturation protease [Candidatus Hodarchaeota archaeon]
MASSKFLVVLGVGNDIRMDDGAGIRVVEHLERDPTLKPLDISFKYLNTGGFDILDEIDGFYYAIIIDAADMADQGFRPGEFIHISDLNELRIGEPRSLSSHGIGVLPILKYAEDSGYKIPQKIEIFGIQVKETRFFSEQLTPEVAEGVEKLVILLRQHILTLFDESN